MNMTRTRRFLATCATPIALTVLLAQPAGRAQPDPGPHPSLAHGHEYHELVVDPNPLKNFASLHYGKDDHGGTYEPGEHAMPPPFAGVVFNFLAFVWLLGRFAYPSVKRVVRERHDEIAASLAEGARLREAARARLADYDQKIAALDSEIAALVGGIRREAEAEKTRIIADADARAQRMQRDAEQQIAADMVRVRATLEREAVEAAIAIAERLLVEKTTDADQRVLADRFLKGLQESARRRTHL
jgi:F-type H+-transporting ATPase subunit b